MKYRDNFIMNVNMLSEMRKAGTLVANILCKLQEYIKSGVTVQEINSLCENWMREANAVSSALGYYNFPNQVCVSINEVVCHGAINQTIKTGDIVSVDVVLRLNGFHGDSCYTYICGETNERCKLLVKVAYEAMWSAIEIIKEGTTVGDLGAAMYCYARKFGFEVIRDFCGHGIGTEMHMSPSIPFYGIQGQGEVLKEGMFITVEPMVCEGKYQIKILSDKWTALMKDGKMAAQFEHTVAVYKEGYEVLTYNWQDALNKKTRSNVVGAN